MSTIASETPFHDQICESALWHFQRGEWEAGMAALNKLVRKYPLNRELRALRHEMRLRASIDHDELVDQSLARQRRIMTISIQIAFLVLFVTLAIWGFKASSAWLLRRWDDARLMADREMQTIETRAKFRDAQILLRGGRVSEAQELLEEISLIDPNFPGLNTLLEQANSSSALDLKYQEALQNIQYGRLTAAYSLLQDISLEEPNYKDLHIRMADVEKQLTLKDMLTRADSLFFEEQWDQAAGAYESLHALDPSYQADSVEQRLYESYVNTAQTALNNQNNSLEALEIAELYFRKALALRPRDPDVQAQREAARASVEERLFANYVEAARAALFAQADSLLAQQTAEAFFRKALALQPEAASIKLERELARLYLASQENFNKGNWDAVINDLEFVYSEEPGYALGTAGQTLYEAYMARGDDWMASGAYDTALEDFRRAAVLADQEPETDMRLYQAQLKVAEVLGILGDYQAAVRIYQLALEIGEVRAHINKNKADFSTALLEADSYTKAGNYNAAYRRYREAVRIASGEYKTIIHVVQPGEYLTMLASRYQSTVQAIVDANGILNPNKIFTNQELFIPVLP